MDILKYIQKNPKFSIAIGTLVIATSTLIVTTFTMYFIMKSSNAQYALVRPIISNQLKTIEYDTKNIKIKFKLRNIGKSTAVIESYQIKMSTDNYSDLRLNFSRRAIIHANKSTIYTLFNDRFITKDKLDIVKLIDNGLFLQTNYSCRELPNEYWSESSWFSGFNWHNKSIVGVTSN